MRICGSLFCRAVINFGRSHGMSGRISVRHAPRLRLDRGVSSLRLCRRVSPQTRGEGLTRRCRPACRKATRRATKGSQGGGDSPILIHIHVFIPIRVSPPRWTSHPDNANASKRLKTLRKQAETVVSGSNRPTHFVNEVMFFVNGNRGGEVPSAVAAEARLFSCYPPNR